MTAPARLGVATEQAVGLWKTLTTAIAQAVQQRRPPSPHFEHEQPSKPFADQIHYVRSHCVDCIGASARATTLMFA
jgi:hypothetical protein